MPYSHNFLTLFICFHTVPQIEPRAFCTLGKGFATEKLTLDLPRSKLKVVATALSFDLQFH